LIKRNTLSLSFVEAPEKIHQMWKGRKSRKLESSTSPSVKFTDENWKGRRDGTFFPFGGGNWIFRSIFKEHMELSAFSFTFSLSIGLYYYYERMGNPRRITYIVVSIMCSCWRRSKKKTWAKKLIKLFRLHVYWSIFVEHDTNT